MGKIFNYNCLYFDDELESQLNPLEDLIYILGSKYNLNIAKKDNVKDFREELNKGGYKLLFIDIRIDIKKGGGTVGNRPAHRTGIGLIEEIRNGKYEKKNGEGTPRNIPIIVVTAVAEMKAQEEIIKIGRGNNNEYKFALFEKPADDFEIGDKANEFLQDEKG